MKTFLVTGGTSGVGKAIAAGIAASGANVVIVSRTVTNGEKVVKEIAEKTNNKNVSFLVADLSSIKSVYQLSKQFKQQHQNLHGLINVAGAWYFKKEMTSEGFDKSFVINYLSHFALTNFLLDLLKSTDDARIVTVGGATRFLKKPKLDLGDLQLSKSYSFIKSISLALFARFYFAFELADRLAGTSASSIVFHPGFVKSNLGKDTAPWWFKLIMKLSSDVRNAPETCESGVFVATIENAKSINGKFIDDKKEVVEVRGLFDDTTGKDLWLLSEKLIAPYVTEQNNN